MTDKTTTADDVRDHLCLILRQPAVNTTIRLVDRDERRNWDDMFRDVKITADYPDEPGDPLVLTLDDGKSYRVTVEEV